MSNDKNSYSGYRSQNSGKNKKRTSNRTSKKTAKSSQDKKSSALSSRNGAARNPSAAKPGLDKREGAYGQAAVRRDANTQKSGSKAAGQKQLQEKRKQEQKLQKKLNKEKKAKERKENFASLASSVLYLSKKLVVVLLVLLILGEVMLSLNFKSQLDALQFDINDISSKLEKEQNIIKELNSEKESAYKSETIENFARYRLGMIYPTREQTVYINLD